MNQITEIKKAQHVRLLDVFVIGPAMAYAGTRKELDPLTRFILLTAGLGTVLYNGRNWWLNEQEFKRLKQSHRNVHTPGVDHQSNNRPRNK